MSIASEISRLQTAKADLKTAIEGKGVTVPSTTKIDGYADLVDEIEQGGGGGIIDALRAGTKTKIGDGEMATLLQYTYCNYMCYGISGLTEIVDNTSFAEGSAQLYSIFQNCASLTKVILPNMRNNASWGTGRFRLAFADCPLLTEIDFSSYERLFQDVAGGGVLSSDYRNANTVLLKAKLNASSVGIGDGRNVIWRCTALTDLELSGQASDHVFLDYCTALNSASVLNVLNHLSPSASGKKCVFGGLTIPSSDENYEAISAKVAALTNWTISGLTL